MDAISRNQQSLLPGCCCMQMMMPTSDDKAEFKWQAQAVWPWQSRAQLNVNSQSALIRSPARSKWGSMVGVLCDRKIPDRLKSKIYRIVVHKVHEVALYGAECCPATVEVETRLNVLKTEVLRGMAGASAWNKVVRFGVTPMGGKISAKLNLVGMLPCFFASGDTV